jgi:hypothetical protein
MASYQIPQFLDSGDKILGPLNMRQFGYALAGGFLSVVTYTIVDGLVKGLGWYAAIPCIPIVAVFAYLALGKYNGRDSEIYVLKAIIYNLKPRIMIYTRVPNNTDLDEKLAGLTDQKIRQEWQNRLNAQKVMADNTFATFEDQSVFDRAQKIQALGRSLDGGLTAAQRTARQGDLQRQRIEEQIRATSPKKIPPRPTSNSYIQPAATAPVTKATDLSSPENNYFE